MPEQRTGPGAPAPEVLWRPSAGRVEGCRLTRFAEQVRQRHGVEVSHDSEGYEALRQWSVEHLEDFWAEVWDHAVRWFADHLAARSGVARPGTSAVER